MSNKFFTKTLTVIVSCAFALSAITGCVAPHDNAPTDQKYNYASASIANDAMTRSIDAGTAMTNEDDDYAAHEWSQNLAPEGYAAYGDAIVSFDPEPGQYVYTGFDALGRTTLAYACITPDDYWREKSEDREDFKKDADTISGWGHNEKVSVTFPNDRVYNGYFYNRSHLIADSLGGSSSPENLVTGTRFQNVGCGGGGGMGYAEDLARDWLSEANHGDTLYYAVTPVYVGDELVPRSVYVDIKSSDGKLNRHIETFNVSGDITGTYSVDYATGKILG